MESAKPHIQLQWRNRTVLDVRLGLTPLSATERLTEQSAGVVPWKTHCETFKTGLFKPYCVNIHVRVSLKSPFLPAHGSFAGSSTGWNFRLVPSKVYL